MATALAALINVVPMAASLLNAARWKTFLIGAISATSGALVLTDGAFTADDVGKKIAIDGAGASGAIYEGTISAYTSATQVTVSPVASTTVVGATVSYGGRLGDDRRNLTELNQAAFIADEAHYLPIAETEGHWIRGEIMTLSADIPHNTVLSSLFFHIGALGRVFIRTGPLDAYVPGKRAQPEEITRLRANTGTTPFDTYGALAHNVAGSQIGGLFWMPEDENLIQYTGDGAKLYYVASYSRGTDLKTPLIYAGSIVSFIVAYLLAKEGAKNPEHAQAHGAYSQAVIAGIRANEQKVPTLEDFQNDAIPARTQ